ncbi:23459_t:CDS:2 [Gigaspora rosea]|nr:23459_t:CDS:2 [Gigaspora rosea]
MKPYSPKSIYNCYCAIACYLKDNSLMYPRPNLFDETCYGTLLKSLDGKIKTIQDLNPRFADKSDSLSFEENGKFTPIADILYYMNKHPSGFLVQEFFLRIAPRKDNLYSIWFVNSALGWHSHENMIHEICNVTGISMQLRKITNHSLRRTAIQILTELNVTADRIMPFSGHFTLNGVMSYQTFTPQVMHNMVSLIIPDCDSPENLSKHTSK